MGDTDSVTVAAADEVDLPLRGVRVLEFGGFLAAPYAGTIMANMGAEVVKVEPPSGEPFRRGRDDRDHFFVQYNRGKKSVSVDATTDQGREQILALVADADVVIENMRPRKMEALGLGYEVCRERNPSIVYASVTGFGDFGPLADRPSFDSIGQSMSGLYSILSEPEDPQLSGTCLADLTSGITLALGVLGALVRCKATGVGTRIETSMLEATSMLTIDAVSLFDESGVSPTRESRNPQANNYCLRTQDDRHITVHLSSADKFWRGFLRALGRMDLADDPRFADYHSRTANFFELRDIVRPLLLERPLDEWVELFADNDVPCSPVLAVEDVLQDAQWKRLEMYHTDPRDHVVVEAPWRFDGVRPLRPWQPPRLGEHNAEFLPMAAESGAST